MKTPLLPLPPLPPLERRTTMKLLLQIIVSLITGVAFALALNVAYQGLWLLSIIVVAFAFTLIISTWRALP